MTRVSTGLAEGQGARFIPMSHEAIEVVGVEVVGVEVVSVEVVGVARDVVSWLHTPLLHWAPERQQVEPQQVAPGKQHPVRTVGQQTALDTRETRCSKSSIRDMNFRKAGYNGNQGPGP